MTARTLDWPVQTAAAPRLGAAAWTRRLDPLLLGVLVANLAHAALFAWAYPQQRFDTDLVAYLVYFRNWAAGDPSLFGVRYFMHPKALLVFTLGPLGSVPAAFACTAVASAALGGLVYVISRDHFGRTAALFIAAFLLLDPSKAFLTLKSSADLYVALLLFAAIALSDRGRLLAAAACLLLAALVKPVALPCVAYFLTLPRGTPRRWLAAALPLLAIPLTLWANHALLGSLHGTDRFFEEFTALRGGDSVGPDSVLHFALWTQLVKQQRFAATAVWALIGMLMWLGADRRRLTSPLWLMPLLFLGGYLLLSVVSRFMPFFRFFWLLDVWFLMFLVYGIVEGTRRLAAGRRWVQVACAGFAFWLLADAGILRQIDYRRDIALSFERGMAFAAVAEPILQAHLQAPQRLQAPIALAPYFMWQLPEAARTHRIDTAEAGALEPPNDPPEWIVYVPDLYASAAAQNWVPDTIQHGSYHVVAGDGTAALLMRDDVAPLAAALAPEPPQ
jgi:hypothetical protein